MKNARGTGPPPVPPAAPISVSVSFTFDGAGIVAARKPVIGPHGEAADTFDRK